ncbi:MAG: hypothetical protein HYW79_00395 [Parcubacteria group bacterium]|nr:hypothetical protein [Parcubacteria group bacterium]
MANETALLNGSETHRPRAISKSATELVPSSVPIDVKPPAPMASPSRLVTAVVVPSSHAPFQPQVEGSFPVGASFVK